MDDQLVDLVGAQVSEKPFFFCHFCWLLEDLLFQNVSGVDFGGNFRGF